MAVRRDTKQGKRAARLALPFVLCCFLLLVWIGWSWILASSLGIGPAILIAAMISMLAAILARFAGAATAEARDQETANAGLSALRASALALIVLLISTAGIVTAFLYFVGSTSILQRDVNQAQADVAHLSSTANSLLADQVYPAKRRRVVGLLENLRIEIENPSGRKTCGVGDNAKRVIATIKTILPDFGIMTGSDVDHVCGSPELAGINQAYHDWALRLLENDPSYVQTDASARSNALYAINSNLQVASKELKRISLGLTRHGEASTTVSIPEAQRGLQDADNHYVDSYNILAAKVQIPIDISKQLDIEASTNLGSYDGTLRTVWKHPDAMIIGYILIALALDLSLVGLFASVSGKRGTYPVTDGWRRRSTLIEDPAFLWVNRA